ncbi:MAG: hypothetical protein KA004_17080 [Verrucomicrobiales bacterium]|nr:hypothetical protein [Verrucomicrobiales bacterium]
MISTCPAGRRRYVEVLAAYLLRPENRKFIDEHHWWANTADAADLAYLKELCAAHPDYFKLIPARMKPDGYRTVYSFFDAAYHQRGVLYLRFDDDIVFIAPRAVERLLEFRVAHPEYFLVYANIVNNGCLDHLRQRLGLVEFAPFMASPSGSSHKSGRYGEAVHWTFLRHLAEGRLAEHETMFPHWVLPYFERVSINCFCWNGEDMAQVTIPEEDEHFLARVAPKLLGRPNVVCGGAVVAHFAFGPQRHHLDKTDILQHYRAICEGAPIPLPVASREAFPVEKLSVCFFTCKRAAQGKKNYISGSLENLERATRTKRLGPVHVVVDGPEGAFAGGGAADELGAQVHPVPVEVWGQARVGPSSAYVPAGGSSAGEVRNVSEWNVHRRIAYSNERCFELALEDEDCAGVLICEDDVDFREGFAEKLQQVLDDLAGDGRRWFTLSLYTVGDMGLDAKPELDMGELYGINPEWYFWGGQAVFFPAMPFPLPGNTGRGAAGGTFPARRRRMTNWRGGSGIPPGADSAMPGDITDAIGIWSSTAGKSRPA